MPFVAKKKSHLFERKKKNEKTLLTTPIWQKKTKSQRKNKLVFFSFVFWSCSFLQWRTILKTCYRFFWILPKSKSLILLANWNRICKFCLFANIFWKKKNNTKYRHTYAIWIVIMLDSSFKWKKQENQNKNTK